MPRDRLRIAKVLYRSPRIDTYVDSIAAIAAAFPQIEEVRLTYPVGGRVADVLDQIQARLVALASDDTYARAARLRFTDAEEDVTSPELVRGCGLVDVTAVPKQDAIEVAALAIERNTARVGHFRWMETRRGGETFRVGVQPYEYADLLSKGAAGALRRNYIARKHVIVALGGLFLCILIMAIAKIVWPALIIPNDVINVLSLLIGGAGLYLAAVSLRVR